jgi:general stress protein 26
MENPTHLFSEEAIDKIAKIAKNTKICMFCTHLFEQPIQARPMTIKEVDDEGNIWFISSKNSNKNYEIRSDNQVQLFFSNSNDCEYLSLYGKAFIYNDKATIEKLWTPIVNAWFEEGKDDPKVTVIKVHPEEGYYWDSDNSKIVSFLKIAASALTGLETEVGNHGNLKL